MRRAPEWIGKTDDSPVPPRVRLRVYERHDGRCWLSGRKIMPGEPWELEHKVALCNGGEHRESNLAPALRKPHREKTKLDLAEKARTYRKKKANLGIKGARKWSRYKRKMNGQVIDRLTGEPVGKAH